MTEERRGLRVAAVMGGLSAERDVSLMTGACVVRHLAGRHQVLPVEIAADGRWHVSESFVGGGLALDPANWRGQAALDSLAAIDRLRSEGVEVVFNALHGPGGEDGSFQGFLRHVGLPFTGPDVIPAAVTMDKWLTKCVLRSVGIDTPDAMPIDGVRAQSAAEWSELVAGWSRRVSMPWVLKPNRLGSSVGVEVFADATAFLHRALNDGTFLRWQPGSGEGDTSYLVESRVEGRELTCGVVEIDGGARALPPIEIRPRQSSFFDYHAKYTPGASEEICPAPLSAHDTARVEDLALRVHRTFACAPLSRTDLFLRGDGSLTVLEVNTLPGMTPTSLIPQAAAQAGIKLGDLLDGIVWHGLRRGAWAPVRAPSHGIGERNSLTVSG